MNKALVIYDATGRIWSIVYGEEEAPQGVPAFESLVGNNVWEPGAAGSESLWAKVTE